MELSGKGRILRDMKVTRAIFPGFILSLLLLSGCATQYSVYVDALTAVPAVAGRGASYTMVSATPGVESTDLFFKEVVRHVGPALEKSGFRAAAEGQVGDLQIAVDAHLSDPLVETRQYSEPIYFDSPGYVQTIRVPVVGQDGKVSHYAYTRYWTGPRTRFAGYVDRDQQITVYDKVLRLSAKEVGADGEVGAEAWAVTVRLRSPSTDYRSALPYMMVAAQPYLGSRTEGEIVVRVSEEAEELAQYKTRLGDGG